MNKPVKKPMRCKAYNLVIELELQAVTCPGVWLCNNGKVTIQIYLLGLCTQTTALNPVFPLLCHEKFVFRKSFSNIKKLNDIDAKMSREIVYIELIQWEDCDTGNVLANFKTTLMELLYPYPNYRGVVAGTDVDLLMEPTRIFPGIIAPKMEVSTKFTLGEILCNIKDDKKNEVIVVNPKLISSKCVPRRCVPAHQKKVCHTDKYHKSKMQKPSRNKHFEPKKSNLHAPKPIKQCRQPLLKCTCSDDDYDTNFMKEKICQLRSYNPEPQCTCNVNNKIPCKLCTRYKSYFTNTCNCCAPKLATREPAKCCCCSKVKKHSGDHQVTVKQYKMCTCDIAKPCSSRSAAKSCRHYLTSKPKLESEIQEKIHQGLSTTRCSSNLTPRENSCEGTCDEGFYRDMENFYKQLYLKAHYKLKNVRCNCNKKC